MKESHENFGCLLSGVLQIKFFNNLLCIFRHWSGTLTFSHLLFLARTRIQSPFWKAEVNVFRFMCWRMGEKTLNLVSSFIFSALDVVLIFLLLDGSIILCVYVYVPRVLGLAQYSTQLPPQWKFKGERKLSKLHELRNVLCYKRKRHDYCSSGIFIVCVDRWQMHGRLTKSMAS